MPNEQTYDESTEHRRLRPNDNDRPAFVRWLDNVFYVGAEVCFLGVGGLLAVTLVALWPGFRQLGTAVVLSVTIGLGATIRGGWLNVGRPWPEATVKSVLARCGWYTLVIGTGVFGSAWAGATLESAAVTAGCATVMSVLGAVGVPWLTNC